MDNSGDIYPMIVRTYSDSTFTGIIDEDVSTQKITITDITTVSVQEVSLTNNQANKLATDLVFTFIPTKTVPSNGFININIPSIQIPLTQGTIAVTNCLLSSNQESYVNSA